MKKPLFVLLSSLLLTVSCKKDQPHPTSIYPETSLSPQAVVLDNRFQPLDSEDEYMINQIIMLTYGFRSFAHDTDLMDIVYDKCDAAANYEVSYSDLIAEDSDFKTLMNNYLRPRYFSSEASNYDCYVDIDNSMVYASVDYYPNIYIPNIKTADLNELPYVCVGAAEINNGDSIIAYRIFSDGSFSEVLLGENDALALENPVIIINNGTSHVEEDNGEDNYEVVESNLPNPNPQDARDYQWESWQIKNGFRYENSGGSDVWSHHTFYDANGYYIQNAFHYIVGIYKNRIANVPAAHVGSSTLFQYMSRNMLPGSLTSSQASQYVYMHITTFEYDWYTSTKLVQYCNAYSPVIHSPRMKYSHEWYHNSICNINHYSWLPGVNYVFGFGNNKSYFRIKRVQ